MNLTEVLNSALPDIPLKTVGERRPRLHPKLIVRQDEVDGEPMVTAVISGKCWIYRLNAVQWQFAQLFDGTRSLEQARQAFMEQTGIELTIEQVREFVEDLESQGFWYRTPLEENIVLKEKLAEDRRKHLKRKEKAIDFAELSVSGWDPDHFLDRVYPYLKFIFSLWFTVLSLVMFGFMVYLCISRWDEYFGDTVRFFDFTQRDFLGVVSFYALGCVVLFIHECGHALACKHYGGQVHDMGFHLIYLTPAFYVDSSEIWVYGDKTQRLLTIVWGAWAEMLVGAFAAPFWWGSARGSFVHEAAYKLLLITGLSVVFFNWNPLIKLDGYYLFTELTGIPEIKEKSTAYVSQWIKRHIFRLPVEVDYVPRKHRLTYVVYCVLSGLYSYALLYFVARLAGNICRAYSAQWGFLGFFGVMLLLFRSRIKMLGRFMKTLYLDRRERVRAWFTPTRTAVVAAVLLVGLFLPLWRDGVDGRFVLEPYRRAVLRAQVPGMVAAVYVDEGQVVNAGAPLMRLRNLKLESEAAQTTADLRVASARATQAELHYAELGPARNERQRLAESSRQLAEQVSLLQINSPIAGVIVTPQVGDLLGSYLESGNEAVEIADLSTLRVRIYVREVDVHKVQTGAHARLLCDGQSGFLDSTVSSIAPVSGNRASGLAEEDPYKGLRPSSFYAADVLVSNPNGRLKVGHPGTGRIYGSRHSLAYYLWEPIGDLAGRKIW